MNEGNEGRWAIDGAKGHGMVHLLGGIRSCKGKFWLQVRCNGDLAITHRSIP
jgi:hypothetical protein